MNGPIAQAVSLCLAGNAFLQGFNDPAYLNNSTFQFCHTVNFIKFTRNILNKIQSNVYAVNPLEWFNKEAQDQIKGYYLLRIPRNNHSMPDWRLTGLIDSDSGWQIIAIKNNNKCQHWSAKWEVFNLQAADRKVWSVNYSLTKTDNNIACIRDLNELSNELMENLIKISTFAYKHDFEFFGKRFDNAIETIRTDGQKLYGYHTDLVPRCFTDPRINFLLDACQSAWVFSGMGAWNDLIFKGEEESNYEKLTSDLYNVINTVIEACVINSLFLTE